MMNYFIVALIGYIFGCMQFSYILGKTFRNVDIRTLGHGNAGASNAVVSLGWKYGIAVALLDIFKAIISILIVKGLFRNAVNIEQLNFYLYLNGFFVIVGHNHPFFMKFKGGKGTASLIGMLVAINVPMALIGILIIVAVTIVTDYIALGTIALVIYFIIATIYLKFGTGAIIISIVIAMMSIFNHLINIKRIINKEENGLRKAMKRK